MVEKDSPKHSRKLTIHLGTFDLAGKGPGSYVGGVVKLWKDPKKDLLASADSFRKAAGRCLNDCKDEPGIEMLTVPGAVCAALAIELYFKYLHLAESGNSPPRGHKLSQLFSALSAPTQESLRKVRPDIVSVLERNDDHLVDARYHHEADQFSFRQQELLQMAESLASFVRDQYPEKVG